MIEGYGLENVKFRQTESADELVASLWSRGRDAPGGRLTDYMVRWFLIAWTAFVAGTTRLRPSESGGWGTRSRPRVTRDWARRGPCTQRATLDRARGRVGNIPALLCKVLGNGGLGALLGVRPDAAEEEMHGRRRVSRSASALAMLPT